MRYEIEGLDRPSRDVVGRLVTEARTAHELLRDLLDNGHVPTGRKRIALAVAIETVAALIEDLSDDGEAPVDVDGMCTAHA